MKRAECARLELLRVLDGEIARMKKVAQKEDGKGKGKEDVERAVRVRENVVIAVHKLDLASVKSVFGFSRELKSRYVPFTSRLQIRPDDIDLLLFISVFTFI